MSKTPRTDAVYAANLDLPFGSRVEVPKGYAPCDPWELARTLERELAAATERAKRLEQALREIASGNRTAHECVNWARQALANKEPT